jgi:hypothetical protein
LRAGKILGHYKMPKHFNLTITEDSFRYERDENAIASEAALDGIYVVRTTVSAERLDCQDVVRSYKRLSAVKRAFRSLKTIDLHIRPIHHHKADRVRAHVLLCMLGYYVEWHMRCALAPLLFDDEDRPAGEALHSSVVAPAERSPGAQQKANTKRTANGGPIHSFTTMIRDLATLVKNRVQPRTDGVDAFGIITKPTPTQKKALDLLNMRL